MVPPAQKSLKKVLITVKIQNFVDLRKVRQVFTKKSKQKKQICVAVQKVMNPEMM